MDNLYAIKNITNYKIKHIKYLRFYFNFRLIEKPEDSELGVEPIKTTDDDESLVKLIEVHSTSKR